MKDPRCRHRTPAAEDPRTSTPRTRWCRRPGPRRSPRPATRAPTRRPSGSASTTPSPRRSRRAPRSTDAEAGRPARQPPAGAGQPVRDPVHLRRRPSRGPSPSRVAGQHDHRHLPGQYNTTGHDVEAGPALQRHGARRQREHAGHEPAQPGDADQDQGGTTRTRSPGRSTPDRRAQAGAHQVPHAPGPVSADQLLTFKLRVSNNADTPSTYFSPPTTWSSSTPSGRHRAGRLLSNPIPDGGTVPGDGGVWDATARTITWTRRAPRTWRGWTPGRPGSWPTRSGSSTRRSAARPTRTSSTPRPPASTARSPASGPQARRRARPVTTRRTRPTSSRSCCRRSQDVTPDPVTIGTAVTWHVRVTVPKQVIHYDATVVTRCPTGRRRRVQRRHLRQRLPRRRPGDHDPAGRERGRRHLTAPGSSATWAPPPRRTGPRPGADRPVRDTYRNGGARVLDGQSLTNSATVKTNRTDKRSPRRPRSCPALRRRRRPGHRGQPRPGPRADHRQDREQGSDGQTR